MFLYIRNLWLTGQCLGYCQGKVDFSEEKQPVLRIKKVLDEEKSLFSGGSFCTKGGRLLAQERSSITSGTASHPHTPEEKQPKNLIKQSWKEDTLVKVPTGPWISTYTVVKT